MKCVLSTLAVALCMFSLTSALDKRYFIPFGAENGDETLVDLSKGIGTSKSDDGTFLVDVEHIPFFNMTSNTKIQVSYN